MTENNVKIMKLSSGEEIISRMIDDSNARTFHVSSPCHRGILRVTTASSLGPSKSAVA